MKKTVLITGASSGFGEEFAKIFAQKGHDVILVARNESKLHSIANEIKNQFAVSALVMAKDLSQMGQVQAVYDELKEKEIKIDYLVNNAGFGDFGLFYEADYNKLEQMIDVNIKALTKLTHLFLQDMKRSNSGRILNVASTAAFQPGPLMAVYYATKAYVLYFSEALHNELEDTNISVTALCPGASETGFQNAADLNESKLVKGRKLPTAKEIAEYGYTHMMKGSMTVIPGFMNKIGASASRFFPRKMALKIVRKVQEKA